MKYNNLYKIIYSIKAPNGQYINNITHILGESTQYIVNKFEETKQTKDCIILETKDLSRCWYE